MPHTGSAPSQRTRWFRCIWIGSKPTTSKGLKSMRFHSQSKGSRGGGQTRRGFQEVWVCGTNARDSGAPEGSGGRRGPADHTRFGGDEGLRSHAGRAFVTARLKRAAAIILAKVTLGEMAGGDTYGSLFGVTRNPYDVLRTPGGSSGGTAAGVTSNFATVGIGQEFAAYTRRPATWNSLVGMRPTA